MGSLEHKELTYLHHNCFRNKNWAPGSDEYEAFVISQMSWECQTWCISKFEIQYASEFFLERLLNPMVITYSPYYFVYKDLLNASSNHLWCILIYFIWIDVMLYPWISVNYKNTIFKQNFRKFDYLISIFKWLSVTMATSHWPFKWSVFWIYIVCVFLWCIGNTYAIILNLY